MTSERLYPKHANLEDVADEKLAALQLEVLELKKKLAVEEIQKAKLIRVLDGFDALPRRCQDCGWTVGGVPRGLHNYGCEYANTLDEILWATPAEATK